MVENQDKTYDKGRPGLGGRDSTLRMSMLKLMVRASHQRQWNLLINWLRLWGELKSR